MASSSNDDAKKNDDRGVRFGTGVAYDDAYGGAGGDAEYNTSLPTLDEERKMLRDGPDVMAREAMEDLDEGRVSSHPSTLAAMKKSEVSRKILESIKSTGMETEKN